MSGARSFKFEDLCRDTPLLIDAIYESGNKGNSSDDPFHPLLGVGNQGGFRKSKMGKTSNYAFIVLIGQQVLQTFGQVGPAISISLRNPRLKMSNMPLGLLPVDVPPLTGHQPGVRWILAFLRI